ncbi:MAG: T9SS type B sorting domain-containing protein [Flavobacteriales bacterium]|jgi:gliding motility-associated-like protein|nr:T9SS type B sorting domain-containing protein [Flavobacteriales bacterium]
MKKIIIVLIFIFSSLLSFSSHFMGGEITWKCLKGGPNIGQYIFEMKVYRDCSGIAFSQVSETVTHHNYPAVGSATPILMNFVQVSDISPTGAAGSSGNACFDCAAGDVGAVEEYIWRSDPMTLAGNPPAQGWHFTWGSSARSGQITNGMANDPWTLRAVMYAYDTDFPNGVYLPSSPCYDSSPEFKELAKTIICTGYPFAYSHNASDEELDDITYSWAEPLGTSGTYDPSNPSATALVFDPPYSVTSPIPGNPTLDQETGEIAYNSSTSGVFVTCIKVEARKCGQVVAEIYREVQVMLLDCSIYNPPTDGLNDPPTITPAFPGSLNETTVYAGDLVTFNIQAEDLDTYAGGVAQEITLDVSGGQFSADFIDPNLCSNPPCATFNNGTTNVTPPFSSPAIVNGVFEWQTSCSHIYADVGCNSTSNVFTFSIKAFDDFCPANGISIATIKITVVPPIPDLRCISVKGNGDIDLTWNYIANAPPTAEPFFIWHALNLNGPYTVVDSVLFPNNTYTHIGANGNSASQFYFLSNKDGCDTTGADLHSDTLQSIFMDINPMNFGVSAFLDWNNIHEPLLSTSALNYEMYVKKMSSTFYNYLTTPLTSYLYEAVKCSEDLQFYVEIPDASGCISKSSVGTVNLGDTITPITPTITDVSVDANGKSVISWVPSAGSDHYLIYKVTDQGSLFIDSVHGEFNSTYTYLNSEANSLSETFNIKAIDSCSNSMLASPNHNSIYLSSDLNACTQNLTLSWNKYNNWMSEVSYYSVVVEETDLFGITTIVDTNLVDITEYVVTSLIDKYLYKIYIVANDGDTLLSALSNQLLLVPDLPKRPDYNYIEYASINHDNGFVEINCLVDNTAIINYYDIMRSFRDVNDFKKIGEVSFVGGSTIHYTDEFANTSNNFYQYRIYPVDTCGIRLSSPPVFDPTYINDTSFAQTIFLESEINIDYSIVDPTLDEEYTNTLKFNEYDKWLGDVAEYRLYRSINREPFNLLPIRTWDRITNPNEELIHIDIVTDFGEGNGRFCYYIEAIEGNSTPYGPVSEGSFSNVSCISQTPIIFVPNTFTPNGDEHNEVFRPFTNFVSEEGYSFTIFSRNGGVIFTTNDPLKGWDGRLNGNMVQDDNYIFHLQYINGVGEITKKTDIITLVR